MVVVVLMVLAVVLVLMVLAVVLLLLLVVGTVEWHGQKMSRSCRWNLDLCL